MSLKVTQGAQQTNDIWKIAETKNAENFYEMGGFVGNTFVAKLMGDVGKAHQLSIMCDKMSETFEQVIQDQNEYLEDFEFSLDEAAKLEENLTAEIEKLETEIEELIKKRNNGTITEEEEAELTSKSNQIITLRNNFDKQITDKNNEANDIGKKATSLGDNSKIKIATDYGETALEKGQPLAETEDLTKSFWRKLSGSWDKSGVRKAGNDLIDAGNNLLDKVSTTTNTNNLFTKKIK